MDAELIHRLEEVYLRAATPDDQRTIMDAIAALSATPQADERGRPMTYWGGLATPQAAQVPVEKLGDTCIDGGVCYHRCATRCYRRQHCEHFSDYRGPWRYSEPHAAQVPEGYALVPVEPTREMIEAGIMFGTSPNKAAIIWQNMVIAAAKAQVVGR